jgi:hypothetical protein
MTPEDSKTQVFDVARTDVDIDDGGCHCKSLQLGRHHEEKREE